MSFKSTGFTRSLAGALSASALTVAAVAGEPEDLQIPFEVVVRLAPGQTISAINAQYQSSTLDAIPARRWYLLRAPAGLDEEAFAELLRTDPRLQTVELHFTGRDTNPDPGTQSIFFGSNAEQYTNGPAWTAIGVERANLALGGSGVRVAIIDSGIDRTHPAIATRLVETGFNFIDRNTDTRDLGDGIDNDEDGFTDEAVGHGTAVAGVVLRLAPNAAIVPLRALDSDGLTTVFRVASAVNFAAAQGARVINLSLGTTADQQILLDVVQDAVARGAVVVASVGNEGVAEPLRFPAAYSTSTGVIAVAGVSNSGIASWFTNYGPHVSMVAPSEWITSTIPGAAFGSANGTSFGAPMVTATAALLLAQRPTLGVPAARHALVMGSIPIDHLNPGYEGQLGRGFLSLSGTLGRRPVVGILRPRVSDRR